MPNKKIRYEHTNDNIGADLASDSAKARAGIPSDDAKRTPNSVSKELAEKIRNKYFPKKETSVKRRVRVVKRADLEADSGETAGDRWVKTDHVDPIEETDCITDSLEIDNTGADRVEVLEDRTAEGQIQAVETGAPTGWVHMYLRKDEFEELIAKTGKVIDESALAQERILRDQEEIDQLKMETRAMLAQLRAA